MPADWPKFKSLFKRIRGQFSTGQKRSLSEERLWNRGKTLSTATGSVLSCTFNIFITPINLLPFDLRCYSLFLYENRRCFQFQYIDHNFRLSHIRVLSKVLWHPAFFFLFPTQSSNSPNRQPNAPILKNHTSYALPEKSPPSTFFSLLPCHQIGVWKLHKPQLLHLQNQLPHF